LRNSLSSAFLLILPQSPRILSARLTPGDDMWGHFMTCRKLFSSVLAIAVLGASMSAAQQVGSNTYRNPCERGPVPTWELINSTHPGFISFLLNIRPHMPLDVAEYIASAVCDDMSIVGNSAALTRRTNLLLRQTGY
jgi:hypothetical protein